MSLWPQFCCWVYCFKVCTLDPYLIAFFVWLETLVSFVSEFHDFLRSPYLLQRLVPCLLQFFHSCLQGWNPARLRRPHCMWYVPHDEIKGGGVRHSSRPGVMSEFCYWQPLMPIVLSFVAPES